MSQFDLRGFVRFDTSPNYMTPADIRKLRETLKMTQAQFAKRVGCSRETAARWELGLNAPMGLYLKALEKLQAQMKKRK